MGSRICWVPVSSSVLYILSFSSCLPTLYIESCSLCVFTYQTATWACILFVSFRCSIGSFFYRQVRDMIGKGLLDNCCVVVISGGRLTRIEVADVREAFVTGSLECFYSLATELTKLSTLERIQSFGACLRGTRKRRRRQASSRFAATPATHLKRPAMRGTRRELRHECDSFGFSCRIQQDHHLGACKASS